MLEYFDNRLLSGNFAYPINCELDSLSQLGGEFLEKSKIETLRITVNNILVNKDVSNVIGVLRGSVEPDRNAK